MHWPDLANRPSSWCNALCTSRAHDPKVFNTITGACTVAGWTPEAEARLADMAWNACLFVHYNVHIRVQRHPRTHRRSQRLVHMYFCEHAVCMQRRRWDATRSSRPGTTPTEHHDHSRT